MDLAQTHTSTANDVAGDGIQNGKGCSDAGLVHRGDGVDCLLGVMCRCWCSVGVPVMIVMTVSPGYGKEPRESQTWPSC